MPKINLGKVMGDDGQNVFIKFNSVPSDTNAQDTWQNGMDYIGFATSKQKTAPAEGYRWTKFVGQKGSDGAAGAEGATGPQGRQGVQGAEGKGIFVSSQSFGTGIDSYDVSSVRYSKSELAVGDLIISLSNCNVVSVQALSADKTKFTGEYLFNIKGAKGDTGSSAPARETVELEYVTASFDGTTLTLTSNTKVI